MCIRDRITREDGRETQPAFGKLKSGDYIEAFNGTPLSTKEDLVREVGKWNGGEASLTIRRRGENMEVALSPVKGEDGSYKLGALSLIHISLCQRDYKRRNR